MKPNIYMLLLVICMGTVTALKAQDYSMDFDGVNDYVNVGSSVGNGVRSIELSFKPDVTINGSSSDYIALLVRNDATQAHEYGFYFSNLTGHVGQLVFFVRYNGTLREAYSTTTTWTAGTWYHIAGTIDASNGMTLYVNCAAQGTNTSGTGAIETSSEITTIGCWGDANIRFFDGKIDNVRMWSRTLSSSELICGCGYPSSTTNLVADWRMNEGSGSSITDNSGNGNSGTVSGATWVLQNPHNYVIDMDGTNDYVDLGSSVGNQSIRSIEFWFRPDVTINGSGSDYVALLARNDATENKEYGFYISNQTGHVGQLVFFVRYSGTLREAYSTTTSWTGGTWYHVAGTIDATNGMTLYVNTSAQGTNTSGTGVISTTATEITALGRWGDANIRHFDGKFDNLRFWSRTLSATEVANNDCAAPTNKTNLVAEYYFNEGGGTTIVDNMGSYNGTAVNGPAWLCTILCDGMARMANPELNNTEELEVTLVPNPASDIISIVSSYNGNASVKVYDLTGKLVISTSSLTLDIRTLPVGIYTLALYSADGKYVTRKFIKQ